MKRMAHAQLLLQIGKQVQDLGLNGPRPSAVVGSSAIRRSGVIGKGPWAIITRWALATGHLMRIGLEGAWRGSGMPTSFQQFQRPGARGALLVHLLMHHQRLSDFADRWL